MNKKLALIFPGQGSQSVGMGKSFYENSSVAKEIFEIGSDVINIDFKELLFNDSKGLLSQTEYTQPAIMAISLIAYDMFMKSYSKDVDITLLLGHSLGELTACTATSKLDYKDALTLAYNRGKLMSEACNGLDASMMVVLGLSDEVIIKECKRLNDEGFEVYPANFNTNGQVVLAGKKSDLDKCSNNFKDLGAKRAMLLNMSVASHCKFLEPASLKINSEFSKLFTRDLNNKVLSNTTVEYYSKSKDVVELLTKQLTYPVRYNECILKAEEEVDLFVELGNGSILKGLNKKITKKDTYNISDMESLNLFKDII